MEIESTTARISVFAIGIREEENAGMTMEIINSVRMLQYQNRNKLDYKDTDIPIEQTSKPLVPLCTVLCSPPPVSPFN